MDWTKFLDYADNLGLEFSFCSEEEVLRIFRGKTIVVLQKSNKNDIWVLTSNNQRFDKQLSNDPYKLLQLTV